MRSNRAARFVPVQGLQVSAPPSIRAGTSALQSSSRVLGGERGVHSAPARCQELGGDGHTCPVVGCAGLMWVLLLSFPKSPEGGDEYRYSALEETRPEAGWSGGHLILSK